MSTIVWLPSAKLGSEQRLTGDLSDETVDQITAVFNETMARAALLALNVGDAGVLTVLQGDACRTFGRATVASRSYASPHDGLVQARIVFALVEPI